MYDEKIGSVSLVIPLLYITIQLSTALSVTKLIIN